jgi:hypothetical protein
MENKSVLIVFICHNNNTTHECLNKLESSHIIFVGDQPIDNDLRLNPRVTIARELPNNIESEKKLLTFTAWYLVIKNNLFPEYEFLCLLEYDINIDNKFEHNIKDLTIENKHDIISFIMTCGYFLEEINEKVLDEFMVLKGIEEPNKYKHRCWYTSTNHCIRRKVINDFVDWYYPDCYKIKEKDLAKFSWYHERLFYVYMKFKELLIVRINGVTHLYKNSHKTFQDTPLP